MKLIEDWKQSHKLFSMQLNYFAAICDIVVACMVIVEQKFPFDPFWYVVIRLSLTVFSMVARVIAQESKE